MASRPSAHEGERRLASSGVSLDLAGNIGAKSNGYITKTAEVAGMAVHEAVADGSWGTASLEPVDRIRERGDVIRYPHE